MTLIFKCETCDITFFTEESFRQHQNYHEGEKCEHECAKVYGYQCDAKFVSQKSLFEHFLAVHDQKKEETNQIYKCDLCGMVFSSKETIHEHFWAAHQVGQKQLIENVVNNQQPLHQVHDREMPETSPTLNQSVETMPIKLPFKCSVCDLPFAYEYGLQHHMNNVHDRKKTGNNVISSYNQSDMKITIKSVHEGIKANTNQSSDTGTGDLFLLLYK